MLSTKIKLTSKDIYEKEFKSSFKGYNQEEVDQFLDLIALDYETFFKEYEEIVNENQRLKKQVEDLRKQPSQPVGATNFDILKRLSNLEKHVFGNKLFD